MRYALLKSILFILLSLYVRVHAEPSFSNQQIEFFEREVRPILAEHCYSCHSISADKLKAGLVLDSHEGVLQGGDSGPAVVPQNVDESLLIQAVRYEAFEMPPRGKLSDQQIQTLERWVADGAAWPTESDVKVAKREFDWEQRREEHWSWQPIQVSPVPEAFDAKFGLIRNRVDQYLAQRLQQANLPAAAEADKVALVRRLYFDLIGLPPTVQQVDQFLTDSQSDAYERLVDDLLRSPHFGEKWARHWMDLVRYAETCGHEFDYPLPHAYRYRDYLIRAFNADVPYDQFVREHIAGDLLPHPRQNPEEKYNESIIGTGFWFLGEAVHAPTDVRADEVLRIDNQIDVMCKTFLGLTVGCARCHDHKFDPIPTKDYYALAGFLQSSRRQEAMLDPGQKIDTAVAELQRTHASAEQKLIANVVAQLQDWAVRDDQELQPLVELSAQSHPRSNSNNTNQSAAVCFTDFSSLEDWFVTGPAFSAQPVAGWNGSAASPAFRSSTSIASDSLAAPLHGALRSPTFELRHDHIHYRIKAKNAQIRLIVDGYTMDSFSALLFADCTLKNVDTGGEWKWVTQHRDLSHYLGHRAHIEILDHGDGVVEIDQIWFSNGGPPDLDSAEALSAVDDAPEDSQMDRLRSSLTDLAARLQQRKLSNREANFLNTLLQRKLISLGPELQEQLQQAESDKADLAKRIPEPVPVMALTDGTGEEESVHIRGSHVNLGEPVDRRFLLAIAGEQQNSVGDRSGRLELARRMTAANNPFVARVMVNRLWHHLMGRGIVVTVDDFGVMGQSPSHPELLDWLAQDFMDHHWSIKHVIREIVCSSAYRRSSSADDADLADAVRLDPANQLWWRTDVRRLPAEAIRDSLLAVSGSLDETMFGPSVPVHITSFMEGRGRPESGPLDGNGRRSIYIQVRRNFLSPMMLAFDMPSPFNTMGRRSKSLVPSQSLIMMNHPLVQQQAQRWAEKLLAAEADPLQRIQQAVRAATGRYPTEQQREAILQFVQQQAAAYECEVNDLRIWSDVCHMVLNMKDFMFLN